MNDRKKPKAFCQTGMKSWRAPGVGRAKAASGLLNLRTALTEAVTPVIPGRRCCFLSWPGRRGAAPGKRRKKKTARGRCWTQRTGKPLARLLLFSGYTLLELKFKLLALLLPAYEDEEDHA